MAYNISASPSDSKGVAKDILDASPANSATEKDEEIGDDSDLETEISTKDKEKRASKAGIIYLSTVPPGMNVKQIREYFSEFGEINRSFLQPESKKKP